MTALNSSAGSPPGPRLWPWFLGVGGFVVLAMMFVPKDPQADQRAHDLAVYELCMKDFNDPLRDPRSTSLVRGACKQMRDKFVSQYGRAP